MDAIIAQGYDAAGHTGNVGTFSIVAEVAAMAGDTPIIAAGGITTGRHLAASLCLGAAGVWTGTLWLACRESDVDMIIKERILESTVDDTTFSTSISGMTMRVLKCPWTEEWAKPDASGAAAGAVPDAVELRLHPGCQRQPPGRSDDRGRRPGSQLRHHA